MSSALLDPPPTRQSASKPAAVGNSSLKVPLDEFLAWKPEPPNGLKYEWKDGDILMGEDSMNQKERSIVQKLLRAFQKTQSHHEGGELFPETDCYLSGAGCVRRPDLAFFSAAQIAESQQERNPVPEFVIEIVSKHDEMNHHEEKLADYFRSGVKMVWHVLPVIQAVRIYTSQRDQSYAQGPDICSAAPVLPDFQIQAGEIFA